MNDTTTFGADRRTHRHLWIAVAVGLLCSMAVIYRLGTMSLVLGSPQGNWVYVYLQGPQRTFAGAFVRAAIASGVLIALTPVIGRRCEWCLVVAWLVVA